MFAFLTTVVELVGLLLKSLIKSCRRNKKQSQTTDASLQNNRENTECPNTGEREGSTVPKKHRRASITQKTIQTTETTTIYELSGSDASSATPTTTPALPASTTTKIKTIEPVNDD